MLYLAQVQKQTRFLGSSRAKLKLLAFQQRENCWSAVPGEQAIRAAQANRFPAGVLVFVELSKTKQVQRIEEAAPTLVNMLQNFSCQQEKWHFYAEEIAQWQQSLSRASQELTRRETDMQARLEQLQHLEEDFQELIRREVEL